MTQSPTVIYHKINGRRVTMIIDVGGNYYLQEYNVHTSGNTSLVLSEVWSDAMSAKEEARRIS